MIDFNFARVHIDGDGPQNWHEALLWVVGDFFVTRDGNELFRETEFPLLEFAYHLRRWLHGFRGEGPFVYESMESEEKEFLWFRPVGEGWAIGSGAETLAVGLDAEGFRVAFERYLDRLVRELPSVVDLDVEAVITGPK